MVLFIFSPMLVFAVGLVLLWAPGGNQYPSCLAIHIYKANVGNAIKLSDVSNQLNLCLLVHFFAFK